MQFIINRGEQGDRERGKNMQQRCPIGIKLGCCAPSVWYASSPLGHQNDQYIDITACSGSKLYWDKLGFHIDAYWRAYANICILYL